MERNRVTEKPEEVAFISVRKSIKPSESIALEARIFHGDGGRKNQLVILTHPYGPLGGSMHDPLVSAIFDHFAYLGYSTLRFNFRGIGQSTGPKSINGTGQVEDMHTVLQYVRDRVNIAKDFIILVGYSFGAVAACSCLTDYPEVSAFISISYPSSALWLIKLFKSSKISLIPRDSTIPKLFINGSHDSYSSAKSFLEFTKKFAPPKETRTLPNSEHTWHGKEAQVVSTISAWMFDGKIGNDLKKAPSNVGFLSGGTSPTTVASPPGRMDGRRTSIASSSSSPSSSNKSSHPSHGYSTNGGSETTPTISSKAMALQKEAKETYEKQRSELFSVSPKKSSPSSQRGSSTALYSTQSLEHILDEDEQSLGAAPLTSPDSRTMTLERRVPSSPIRTSRHDLSPSSESSPTKHGGFPAPLPMGITSAPVANPSPTLSTTAKTVISELGRSMSAAMPTTSVHHPLVHSRSLSQAPHTILNPSPLSSAGGDTFAEDEVSQSHGVGVTLSKYGNPPAGVHSHRRNVSESVVAVLGGGGMTSAGQRFGARPYVPSQSRTTLSAGGVGGVVPGMSNYTLTLAGPPPPPYSAVGEEKDEVVMSSRQPDSDAQSFMTTRAAPLPSSRSMSSPVSMSPVTSPTRPGGIRPMGPRAPMNAS